jgi:hypothetical protein
MSDRLRGLPGGRTTAASGRPEPPTDVAAGRPRRTRVRHLRLVGGEIPVPLRSEPPTLELPFPLPPLPEPRRPRRWLLVVELATVLGATALGTAIATGADALAEPIDGRPAAYFLLLLALPLWELMPLRPTARIATAAAAWCAVAALWYLFATVSANPWWRGEGAFGLACLVVGWTAALTVWRLWVEPDVA